MKPLTKFENIGSARRWLSVKIRENRGPSALSVSNDNHTKPSVWALSEHDLKLTDIVTRNSGKEGSVHKCKAARFLSCARLGRKMGQSAALIDYAISLAQHHRRLATTGV